MAGVSVEGMPRPGSFSPPDTFTFLHVTHQLSRVGWDSATIPRLWRYQLHYFDGLLAPSLSECDAAAWVASWIRENPLEGPERGGTAWEPYPTSLRIVNWIRWHWRCRAAGGVGLDVAAVNSLAQQAAWLSKRLEHHLLGNHLWANAKALMFAGVFLDTPGASRWRAVGARLLLRELAEQTLGDGGHFELSPMYHAVFTEDALDLLALANAYPDMVAGELITALRGRIQGLLAFARAFTHPDGLPGQFNDTALGEGPDLEGLVGYAARLGVVEQAVPAVGGPVSARLWPDSGYARLVANGADGAVVLADVGHAGPDYIPGHAHADALSFEMSLGERRLFVNGGTSTYEASAERLRQRGTRAHNTVCVDGADSSEVWSSFRLGRRIQEVRAGLDGDDFATSLTGSFLGFQVSGRPVRHQRTWLLKPGELVIDDQLEGQFKTAEAMLHVAPGWIVRQADFGTELVSGEICVQVSTTGVFSLERGTWARGFGENIPVDVISIRFSGKDCRCVVRWNAQQ